jgi:chemotaxis protein CheD
MKTRIEWRRLVVDDLKPTVEACIRMGEMAVDHEGNVLRTLLGSCVGVSLYDRRLRVGGLAHIVLPHARSKDDRAGKFVDTAIPEMMRKMELLVNEPVKLTAKFAGGASMFSQAVSANIGQKNIESCEQLLRKLRIPILARDCGGEKGRRMTFDTSSGRVWIEILGQERFEL